MSGFSLNVREGLFRYLFEATPYQPAAFWGAPYGADSDTELASRQSTAFTVHVAGSSVYADNDTALVYGGMSADINGLVFFDANAAGNKLFTLDYAEPLSVTPSDTVTFAAQDVEVLLADAEGSYSQDLPATLSGTGINVTHNLGSTNVIVQVRQLSDGTIVYPAIRVSTSNIVVITFSTDIADAEYRVVVQVK